MDTVHMLMRFGLSHQEARLYICLYGESGSTGYEAAKACGVSRSNAYAAISNLVEKGGARLIDGKPARYQAVPVEEFCGNVIRGLAELQHLLENEMKAPDEDKNAYVTISGGRNIQDKIKTMISGTRKHIYISMQAKPLSWFLPLLEQAVADSKKVVLISDGETTLKGATIYINPEQGDAIRVISDTATALTGSIDESPGCSCLYSQKGNLVSLLRDSMKNEIRLIELTGGKKI